MGLSHWDEFYFIETAAWNLNASHGFFQAYDPPIFPFILSVIFSVFGIHDYVAIAASEVSALFLCALTFWWTRREFDFSTAIVSVLILASTSIFIYYAKMALSDMTYTLFFSATIFAYHDAIKKNDNLRFLVAGTLLACTIGVKYTGFQPLLVILIFVILSCLPSLRGRERGKRNFSYVRELSNDLAKLWLSIAPVLVFLAVFLLYLAQPFPLLAGRASLTGGIIRNLAQGLNYLIFTVYPLKSGEVSPQFFVSVDFYGNVVAEFVGVLVVAFATVGVMTGIFKRHVNTLLLFTWAMLVFVFFASLPGGWPRVILPMTVPISILAAMGCLRCAGVTARFFSVSTLRTVRKSKLNALIRVSFILLIILVHLYSSFPAVTDAHFGYREAAEFISSNLPNRVVFYRTQPVLLVYLDNSGAHSLMVTGIPLLNQSYAVVLDFIAEESPDYAKIQARVSEMTLVARINNDVPSLNMLDSMSFNALRQGDPDRTSIRIYIQLSTAWSPSSTQSLTFPKPTAEPVLFQVGIVSRSSRSVSPRR